MRWIFLTLLLLNVFILGMNWLEKNDSHSGKARDFKLLEHVREIHAIKMDGAGENGLQGQSTSSICLLLGPMLAERDAEMAERKLSSNQIKANKFVQALDKAPNYWVYLEPFNSRKVAISKLKALQSTGIDSYLISQGSLKNGISLGVFENIDSAKDMLEIRNHQGYLAKMKNLPKSVNKYWVGVNEKYNIELVNKVLFLLKEVKIVAERRQISCESIASAIKLP